MSEKREFSEFELCLIQDIQSAYDRSKPLEGGNLPSVDGMRIPEVRLLADTVTKFRANYRELLWFAARMCNCAPHELTRLHLIADLLAEANDKDTEEP